MDTPSDSSDAGRLLIVLARLRQHKPGLASKTDSIVHTATNLQLLAEDNRPSEGEHLWPEDRWDDDR